MSNYRIETKCIQSGYTPKNGEPRVIPIYQSTTFKYENSDEMGKLFDLEADGYFYTRLQNPTNDAVAAKICDMEGGVAAMLTSSGQAANFYAIMNIFYSLPILRISLLITDKLPSYRILYFYLLIAYYGCLSG